MKKIEKTKNMAVGLVIADDSAGVGKAVVGYGILSRKLPIQMMTITLGENATRREGKDLGSTTINYPEYHAKVLGQDTGNGLFIFLDAGTSAGTAALGAVLGGRRASHIAIDALLLNDESDERRRAPAEHDVKKLLASHGLAQNDATGVYVFGKFAEEVIGAIEQLHRNIWGSRI